uniref:PH_14 domain-containing protein n=1 Tax=Macrostomum lignano TaxID=282301 RepID=A0A1I8I6F6_9PLAT
MTSDIAKRQRTVPSAKAYDFNWRMPVAAHLMKGAVFDRYDEYNGSLEQGCEVKVDEFGFFIYWKSENGEGQVLELSQVSDVRTGSKPKVSCAVSCSSLFLVGFASVVVDCRLFALIVVLCFKIAFYSSYCKGSNVLSATLRYLHL